MTARKPEALKGEPASATGILKLKVTLLGVRPPIWRRLLVAETMNLGGLHDVIQEAMGWERCHLLLFEINGERFSDPEGFPEAKNEDRYRLSRLIKDGVKKFVYTYDFGDDWAHSIIVEGQVAASLPQAGVFATAGRLKAPPLAGVTRHPEPKADRPEGGKPLLTVDRVPCLPRPDQV